MKKAIMILFSIFLIVMIFIVVFFKFFLDSDFTNFSKYDKKFVNDSSGVITVYSDATLSSPIMKLSRGVEVEYNDGEESGEILIDDKRYFIDKKNVKDSLEEIYNFKKGIVTNFTNIYSDYGLISNEPIGYINTGEKVDVVGYKISGDLEWLKINYNGITGYINGLNLTTDLSFVSPVNQEYVGAHNLSEIDLGGNIKKIYSDNETKSIYLNAEGILDPNLMEKLAYYPNLEDVYIEYKTSDTVLTNVESPSLGFEQKILVEREQMSAIFKQLSSKYNLIGEVSVGVDSMLPSSINVGETSYFNPHQTKEWTYFVDLAKDMKQFGFNEVVFTNFGVPTDMVFEDSKNSNVIQMQMLSEYLYDMLWNSNIKVSTKVDYITSTTSEIVNSVQFNNLSNTFDNIYVDAIMSDLPENTFGQLYPWNNPDLTATEWGKQMKVVNDNSISTADFVIITQAYSSPVYPYRQYHSEQVSGIISGFSSSGFNNGYILYNDPTNAGNYDFLSEFLQ